MYYGFETFQEFRNWYIQQMHEFQNLQEELIKLKLLSLGDDKLLMKINEGKRYITAGMKELDRMFMRAALKEVVRELR